MNNEQIIDYLRSRGRAVPPNDLIQTVTAAVETATAPRSWFAPFIPAVAAVAVAAALLILALLIGQPPDVGPGPTGSEQATSAPSGSASSSPTPSQSQLSLLQPGAVVEIPALDTAGQWGTIRIERGEELGGYPDAAVGSDIFVIELFVTYTAERMPNPAQFGSPDWAVLPSDPNAEFFFLVEPRQFERADGIGLRPAMPLGVYPGAVDIFSTPIEGRIAFAIGRNATDLSLELVYHFGGQELVFALREPGPAPEPVVVAKSPEDEAAIALAAAMAAALYTAPDECVNPVDGYTLTFPDAWYTNTATGDTPACSWFTPDFFEVATPGVAPAEIWIAISVIDSQVGYTGLTEIYLSEQLEIDGRPASRVEYNTNATADPDFRGYQYVIPLGENGPTLVAGTHTNAADNYLLAKAVLDRIMASFAFED